MPVRFAMQGVLYLTDTSADQGALRLVPGFHHRLGSCIAHEGAAGLRARDLSGEAIGIAAGAGDLVIWRDDLPHAASRNLGAAPRLVQYLNMYPAWLARQDDWV